MRVIKLLVDRGQRSQEGVVSLLVTMVLMIVISLIALGFAQIARRNQGRQLDQQLSSQAFYAAESGVNDTAQIISAALASPTPPSGTQLDRTSCVSPGYNNIYAPLNTNPYKELNSAGTVNYTCVLVNGDSPTIQTDIGSTAKIIPIDASSSIASIKLSWSSQGQGANPTSNCPTTAKLPTASTFDNCGIGVLRVDLVPTDSAPVNASTLAKETLTFFAVPSPQGTPGTLSALNYAGPNSSTANNDNIIRAKCVNASPNCTIKINIPAAYQAHQQYTMRVLSEYEGSALTVSASNPAGQNIPLSGAQVVIDATGRAQNVVRRIQVYVPLGLQTNQLSDYSIESTDSVCKRYIVMSGNGPGNGYYQQMVGAGFNVNNTTLNPLCQ